MSLMEFQVLRRVRAKTAPRKRVVVDQSDRNRREKREAEMLEATAFAQMNFE